MLAFVLKTIHFLVLSGAPVKAFYGPLADLIVFVHLLYVLFAVGGQVFVLLGACFGWRGVRNVAFRVAHLAAVGLVALEAAMGVDCPLTVWEYDLRLLAGQTVERGMSFVARLARFVIFYDLPGWVFTTIHVAFGLLVILTFVLIPPRSAKK